MSPAAVQFMMVVFADVAERRAWQHANGRGMRHDDGHVMGELAKAAISYVAAGLEDAQFIPADSPAKAAWYPWADGLPAQGQGYRHQLLNAAALLVAEIERIDRLEAFL